MVAIHYRYTMWVATRREKPVRSDRLEGVDSADRLAFFSSHDDRDHIVKHLKEALQICLGMLWA